MPQRVLCNKCNEILYEGKDVKPPDEVIRNCEGKCPKCGSRLSLIPRNVNVTPVIRRRRPIKSRKRTR